MLLNIEASKIPKGIQAKANKIETPDSIDDSGDLSGKREGSDFQNLHRNKRSKSAIQSELEQIPNIGEQTITTLLRKFKSAKRVKMATIEELKELLGDSRAKKIFNYFNQ